MLPTTVILCNVNDANGKLINIIQHAIRKYTV